MSFVIGRGRYGRITYPARSPIVPNVSFAPLTAQFWVDADTSTPIADRTGSISAPFGSIQAAYDAAAAIPLDSVQIIVARSDPDEDVVCGSPIACTIIALNLFSSFGFGADYQAQISDVTVTDGAVGLGGLIILGNVTSAARPIGFVDCSHLGNLTAPGATVSIIESAICATGGTVELENLGIFDSISERSLFTFSGQAWVNLNVDIQSNAGGPNPAGVYGDADEPSESFSGSRSRRIWPANTITAPRTVTLVVAGGGDFATGYIDVYEQGFDVVIQDSVGPTMLITIPAGTSSRRYGFQLPDGTSWVNFRSERL